MAALVTNPASPPEGTPFARIMAAIRARLSLVCGISADFVYPVANDRYAVTILEDFFLYYQAFAPEPFADAGAGRLAAPVTRRVRVYVYTRSGVDVVGTDEVALEGGDESDPVASQTSPTSIGQLNAEEMVYSALFNWMPVSGTRALAIEPIHPAPGSGPPLRAADDDAGIVRTNLDFEVRYVLAIPAADPPY